MRITKTTAQILSPLLFLAGALLGWMIPGATYASSHPQPGQIDCSFSPHLSCRSTATEETLWQASRFAEPVPFSLVQGTLIISQGSRTYAFEQENGQLLWQIDTLSEAHYFYPVVSASKVYLARSDGVLEKRDLDSGKPLWSRKLTAGWLYPPVVTQSAVVTGGQEQALLVVDPSSGDIHSRLDIGQELVAPLIQQGDQIVAASFDRKLQAFRLSPETRSLESLWVATLQAPAFSYVPDQDRLLVADMGGSISRIDKKNGAILWTRKIHNNARFWTQLTPQGLLNLTHSGTLMLLDTTSGQLLGKQQFERQFQRAPLVQGDSITLYDTHGESLQLRQDKIETRLISISYTSNKTRNIK